MIEEKEATKFYKNRTTSADAASLGERLLLTLGIAGLIRRR